MWQLLATIAVAIVPSQLTVLLNLKADIGTFSAGMAATYCASVIILTWCTSKGLRVKPSALITIFLSTFGVFFLFLLLTKVIISRWELLISIAFVSFFAVLPLSMRVKFQKLALYLVTSFLVLFSLAGLTTRLKQKPTATLSVRNKLVRTSFYNLIVRYQDNFVREEATGGAIAEFGDRYLLATGDGQLYIFSWNQETNRIQSTKLATRVPLNRESFISAAAQSGLKMTTGSFRTADILVQNFGDRFRLFASHHHWNNDKHCFTVRVSALSGSYSDFIASKAAQSWETIYESQPCLAFNRKKGSDPFAGYQIGGKLVLLDNHRLLLAIGDHQLDGVYAAEMVSQDKSGSYGKTVLIDFETHTTSIYSMGHRNPQGLDRDSNGNIWLTEHGPKGGDELNLILQGKNYGWPLVTYGNDYYLPSWPLNSRQNQHDGYEPPIFAWIPSIGISALVHVKGSLFKIWKDDLLAAALGDKSIWRLRIESGRVVFAERIAIHERIRDILEDSNGRLILWTEALRDAPTQTSIVIVEPAGDTYESMKGLTSFERGELLYSRCIGCHMLGDGTNHGIGPDLHGVYQRAIASAEGYGYSEGLKGASGKWTEKNLDEFFKSPQTFAPGTTMQVGGIPDQMERKSLIEYLKSQK